MRAYEKGLLRMLPCKPGDIIYVIDWKRRDIKAAQVYSIKYTPHDVILECYPHHITIGKNTIGRIVFFSLKEAQRALAGRETMPKHAFLKPESRKYPYKIKKEWKAGQNDKVT